MATWDRPTSSWLTGFLRIEEAFPRALADEARQIL
jgi:hypothetical protein